MFKIVIPAPINKNNSCILQDDEKDAILEETRKIIEETTKQSIALQQNENVISKQKINRGEVKYLNGNKVVIWPAIQEDWTIEEIVMRASPPGWLDVFEQALPEIINISNALEKESQLMGKWFPLKRDLFKAFHLTPLNKVKIVIIGQDPYPQLNSHSGLPRAQGLSFSVSKNDAIPASLRVIYDEIQSNYPDEFIRPSHGDLTNIARQGVLFFNKRLTVRHNQSASHKSIWDGFNSVIINAIAAVNPECIFIMWGRDAQECQKMLGSKSRTLCAPHPSPSNRGGGFRGCGHFRKANEILVSQGKTQVDWNP